MEELLTVISHIDRYGKSMFRLQWFFFFFAWEATRGSILTLDKLIKRGRILVNRCYMCKGEAESYEHLLSWCTFAYKLWMLAYSLLGINWVIGGPVREEIWAWKGNTGGGVG